MDAIVEPNSQLQVRLTEQRSAQGGHVRYFRIAQCHCEQPVAHARAYGAGGFTAVDARAVVAPISVEGDVVWRGRDRHGGGTGVTRTGAVDADRCYRPARDCGRGRRARTPAARNRNRRRRDITIAAKGDGTTGDEIASQVGDGGGLTADVRTGDKRKLELPSASEVRAVVQHPALVSNNH